MTDDDERSNLLALAGDEDTGRELLLTADERQHAALLHGLLSMYESSMRETCTELGVLALGVALEDIAEAADPDFDPAGTRQEAAKLILAHGAARTPDAEGAFCAFGADAFNEVIERVCGAGEDCELIRAVVWIWRRLLPHLHTREGLEILRRVRW
jgi:hypothetical protein